MLTRNRETKPDADGNYRPYIGHKADGKPARFNLGKDFDQYVLRRERITKLYDESCRVRQGYGANPTWTAAALYAAKFLSDGTTLIPLPPASIINEAAAPNWIGQYNDCWQPQEPAALLWSHAVASRHYPSIKWYLPDVQAAQAAIEHGQHVFNAHARPVANLMAASLNAPRAIPGTLHQALREFAKVQETKQGKKFGAGTAANHQQQVKALLATHPDVALGLLDLEHCRNLFQYWADRPNLPESEERYSTHTAKHRINELNQFFNWLHSTPSYGWRKPEDFDAIDRTIAKDEVKRSIKSLIAKPTLSLSDLVAINEQCDTLDRALLYLGLNCSFGASEAGQLEADDLYLHQANPLAHVWKHANFKSSSEDSWVAFLRPKTGVAGCWQLWPETVAALEKWLAIRPKSETERIIVTDEGTSLYREGSKNAQSGFANRWKRLLAKANKGRAKEDHIKLPFGTLRDMFSEWAVHQGESEAASVGLCHGKPFKDDLLGCYSNTPFPRLFEVQKRYRDHLTPVFDAVK